MCVTSSILDAKVILQAYYILYIMNENMGHLQKSKKFQTIFNQGLIARDVTRALHVTSPGRCTWRHQGDGDDRHDCFTTKNDYNNKCLRYFKDALCNKPQRNVYIQFLWSIAYFSLEYNIIAEVNYISQMYNWLMLYDKHSGIIYYGLCNVLRW